MNRSVISYIKLIAVIFIWGSVYHVAKYLVKDTDIYTVAFLRFLISSIILALMYCRRYHQLVVLNSQHWKLLFLGGLFGVFSYTTLFFIAESLIPANQVAILFALAPCITVLLSKYFLHQNISLIAYLGIIVALIGTVVVISVTEPACSGKLICYDLVKNLSVGQICALGTAVVMAVYNVINRKLSQLEVGSLTITTFTTIFGFILLSVNFLVFGASINDIVHKPLLFWVAIIYISVLATVVCYKWFSDSIQLIGTSNTAVFLNGIPLAAIILGFVFFDQKISVDVAIAAMLIIGGVILTNSQAIIIIIKKKFI